MAALLLLASLSPLEAQLTLQTDQVTDLSFRPVFKVRPLRSFEEAHDLLGQEVDDSTWETFYAPEDWAKGPYPHHEGPVLYRLTVWLESEPRDQMALFWGYGIENDWTWVNGELIGHNGILGEAAVPTYTAYDVYRFYRVPVGLLRSGKNVIATVIVPYTRAGIFRGPILFGPLHLVSRYPDNERTILILFLGVYLLVGITYLLIAIRSPRELTHWGFAGFILLFTFYFLLRSQLKYLISLDYLLLKRLELILAAIAPSVFLFFLLSFYGSKHRIVHYAFYLTSVVSTVLLLILPENRHWSQVLFWMLQPSWIVLMGLTLWTLFRNWNMHPDGKPMGLSIGFVVLTLFYDLLVSRQIIPFRSVYFIAHFAFFVYILATSWILATRFAKMYTRMELLVEEKTATLKKAYEELERIAIHDPLTGLFNRMEWTRRLGGEWNRFRRYGMNINKPFSLLFLDMDNFKMVNDTYGHQAGDDLLRLVAAILKTRLRSVDISARLGGDEFVVLLPETGRNNARIVAEKILAQFRADRDVFLEELKSRTNAEIPADKLPGLSIGIAECPEDGEISPEELLQTADRALYTAKQTGKDRVVVAERNQNPHRS